MDKPTGTTLMTLLLGAGVILHSSPGHNAIKPPAHDPAAKRPAAAADGEGPWKASNDYWRPLRKLTPAPPASRNQENNPPLDKWGIPENRSSIPRTAHAVIALVPDPVHSHLAPEFDRAVDVLIGAASDNRYLVSYSWLPWKVPSAKAEANEDKAREQEPGLLIFDQRLTSGETSTVLYMFLVAEMPSTGANAEQLRRALEYEFELRKQLGPTFPTDEDGSLRVIGPQYSGSARSLDLAINAVLMDGSINQGSVHKRKILGTTSTEPAWRILNRCAKDPCSPNPDSSTFYASFASDQAEPAMKDVMQERNYADGQGVVLEEDGTSYGRGSESQGSPTPIPFPREISLLRNSYQDNQTEKTSTDDATPTPYLHMTTHDDGSPDTLPDLSTTVTPLSQESQLMSIAHALTLQRAKLAYIVASNPLDALFLAKSLHRSNPDTRLVMEPDLLLQREGDDAPYIGSLAMTPYPLVWMARTAEDRRLRSFASGEMEAYYNAASFTLGNMTRHTAQGNPPLYGYSPSYLSGSCENGDGFCPRLWLTVVGNDGYYPIALLKSSSNLMGIPLPGKNEAAPVTTSRPITLSPSGAWQALCALVALVCLLHIAALWSASYASAQTCDLEIEQNCERYRRMLYCQIGGAVLFLMSAVVSMPVAAYLRGNPDFRLDPLDQAIAAGTLTCGVVSWLSAIGKTWRWHKTDFGNHHSFLQMPEKTICFLLYIGGIVATLILAAIWLVLCLRSGGDRKLGLFFSYRCLHPMSAVSPLAPALLLLCGWFFWAFLHARRLRLTRHSRPRLPDLKNIQPHLLPGPHTNLQSLLVSDGLLEATVIEDATCLMISRRLLQEAFKIDPKPLPGSRTRAHVVDGALLFLLAALTGAWIATSPINALDHFAPVLASTTLYELFIGLLLVPLLIITLCAATRLFLVSASLRERLLEPLERMPLRHAFTRLKGFSWIGMLGNSGQLERWRDMARATESVRQIANHPDLPNADALKRHYQDVGATIEVLQNHLANLQTKDPSPSKLRACFLIEDIEKKYAACAEQILQDVLVPQWLLKNESLLESETGKDAKENTAAPGNLVLLAEEFLAFRYLALIRALLAQIRYLLIFITASLVLVMLAINSYPFQPKQELDWCITVVFFAFLAGLVIVFARMHRNALLSRITDKDHGLGMDFYLRVAAFGALPLVTWLATQYPSIGGTLYGVLKPGLEAFK